jgi:L-alanine-DL-glutamate epimerase-like enolase superfamily enzyme
MNTMSILAFTHLAASERNASDLEGPGGIAEGYRSRDRVSTSRVSSPRMELLAPHENLSSDEMSNILIPG